MIEIEHPLPPQASEFLRVNDYSIPTWYEGLVYGVRARVTSGQIVELAPRPFVDYRKELLQVMCQTIDLDRARWPILREEEE